MNVLAASIEYYRAFEEPVFDIRAEWEDGSLKEVEVSVQFSRKHEWATFLVAVVLAPYVL